MVDIEEQWATASFEEKYKAMMAKMTEVDQKRSAEQVAYICKCRTCPTYKESGETNLAFCNQGKGAAIQEQKGCQCSTCPMTKTMSLSWEYYCTRGSALELSEL